MPIFLLVAAAAIYRTRSRSGLVGFVFHQGVTILATGLFGMDGRIKFIDGDVYAAFFAACPVTLDTVLIGIGKSCLSYCKYQNK